MPHILDNQTYKCLKSVQKMFKSSDFYAEDLIFVHPVSEYGTAKGEISRGRHLCQLISFNLNFTFLYCMHAQHYSDYVRRLEVTE